MHSSFYINSSFTGACLVDHQHNLSIAKTALKNKWLILNKISLKIKIKSKRWQNFGITPWHG